MVFTQASLESEMHALEVDDGTLEFALIESTSVFQSNNLTTS
jgi:hypothetical protein